MKGSGRGALSLALFAVSFGTNVATPLFLIYETRLDLSRWTLTALFAIYPIGLAPALAYAGPMSDALGRKRVMVPGVVLSGVASLVMMAGADNVALLFVGRFLLGAVSGIVFVVASAWMQELGSADPMWTARLLGMLMYAGFGLGPFIGGIIGQWGPAPLVLPYMVHIVLVAVSLIFLRSIPETVVPSPGRRIRPNLGIPPGSGPMYWKVMVPTALGVFGLPSLTFGLFPILLRPAMASVALFATGLMFVIAMGSIVPAQLWVGHVGPHRAAPFGLILGTVGCALGLVGVRHRRVAGPVPGRDRHGRRVRHLDDVGVAAGRVDHAPDGSWCAHRRLLCGCLRGDDDASGGRDSGATDRLHIRAGDPHRARRDRLGLAHPRNACDGARPTGARAGQSVAATQSPVTGGMLAIASISSSAAMGRAK